MSAAYFQQMGEGTVSSMDDCVDMSVLSTCDSLLDARQLATVSAVHALASSLPQYHHTSLLEQLSDFVEQLLALKAAVELQFQLTSSHPLTPSPAEDDVPAIRPLTPVGHAADSADGTEPTKLSPQAEQLLMSVFAFTDQLDRAQAAGLAHLAGCSEQLVRALYSRLRGSLRNVLQRVQKKAQKVSQATGIPNSFLTKSATVTSVIRADAEGEDPASASTASASAQQQLVLGFLSNGLHSADGVQPMPRFTQIQQKQQHQMERIIKLLDQNGAIAHPNQAGAVLLAMEKATTFEARSSQLDAISHTTNHVVLLRLVGSKLLHVLDTWLKEAELERQTTFLKSALQV